MIMMMMMLMLLVMMMVVVVSMLMVMMLLPGWHRRAAAQPLSVSLQPVCAGQLGGTVLLLLVHLLFDLLLNVRRRIFEPCLGLPLELALSDLPLFAALLHLPRHARLHQIHNLRDLTAPQLRQLIFCSLGASIPLPLADNVKTLQRLLQILLLHQVLNRMVWAPGAMATCALKASPWDSVRIMQWILPPIMIIGLDQHLGLAQKIIALAASMLAIDVWICRPVHPFISTGPARRQYALLLAVLLLQVLFHLANLILQLLGQPRPAQLLCKRFVFMVRLFGVRHGSGRMQQRDAEHWTSPILPVIATLSPNFA